MGVGRCGYRVGETRSRTDFWLRCYSLAMTFLPATGRFTVNILFFFFPRFFGPPLFGVTAAWFGVLGNKGDIRLSAFLFFRTTAYTNG